MYRVCYAFVTFLGMWPAVKHMRRARPTPHIRAMHPMPGF